MPNAFSNVQIMFVYSFQTVCDIETNNHQYAERGTICLCEQTGIVSCVAIDAHGCYCQTGEYVNGDGVCALKDECQRESLDCILVN